MNVHLDYRNQTPAHVHVAIFVNHGLTGVLCLRRDEVQQFESVFRRGLAHDELRVTGNQIVQISCGCSNFCEPEKLSLDQYCKNVRSRTPVKGDSR